MRCKKLKVFARSFNTIHGLILEIRKIIRYRTCLYKRGKILFKEAINKLKDIIAKIWRFTTWKINFNLIIMEEFIQQIR